MNFTSAASTLFPRLHRARRSIAVGWYRIGEQAQFYAKTITSIGDAVSHYRVELVRLIAVMGLGSGALAVIGGTVVILVGIVGGFLFSVFVQHVTPGAFASQLTLITGLADVVTSLIKAALFGLAAGLIACYKGISVGGGPAGVGNAVNETVVFTFVALFAINILVTSVGVQATI